MNTVYRSVWNAVTRTFVAAAETAKRCGKGNNLRRASTVLAIAASVALSGGWAVAGVTNVTFGLGADALGDRATAVGYQSAAVGTSAVAFGPNAQALNQAALALGAYSTASGVNSVAIGTNANAKTTSSVALGAGSVASENYTVSVGGAGVTRRITNVANGIASTDAAYVGQVNAARSAMSTSLDAMGKRVGDVESGVFQREQPNHCKLEGIFRPFRARSAARVTYDSAARSSVTLGGTSETGAVKLKNVADGVASTERRQRRAVTHTSEI